MPASCPDLCYSIWVSNIFMHIHEIDGNFTPDYYNSSMRLSITDIQGIRREVTSQLGRDAEIVLFGSRIDDQARGGDVDLMITLDHVLGSNAGTAAFLSARLERILNGRKVDVVLVTPDATHHMIHDVAKQTGITL